jgi:hypothetical protein
MIPSDQKIKKKKYVVKRGLGNSEFSVYFIASALK